MYRLIRIAVVAVGGILFICIDNEEGWRDVVRISTKGRYGLRALVDLAVHQTGKPVLLSQIADRQSISKRYLERLFTQLRDSGIIRSVRGAAGGYILNRMPQDVTVAEVLEALEGPITPVDCVLDVERCTQAEVCVTHDLWLELANKIQTTLKDVTLEDLKKRQMEIAKQRAPMYYI